MKTQRGYTRTSSDPKLKSLAQFAENLPDTAFRDTSLGKFSLLENYRKALSNDPSFNGKNLGPAGVVGRTRGAESMRPK